MRHLVIPLLFLCSVCSCVDMPSAPESIGRIAVEAIFASTAAAKQAAVHSVSSMEIAVYHGNEVVASDELRRVGVRWQGDVKVDAGSYWVKLTARKRDVDWIGAAFVTVGAGKTCRPQIRMVSSIAPILKGGLPLLLERKYCPNCDLRGVDLRGGVDLTGATLTGALLAGAILAEAEMRGAYLPGADLRQAYLIDIKLDDSDLTGAKLAGANLSEANMNRVNLTGANLTDADLFRAELEEAILIDADLTGANLVSAYLKGAKLNGAVLLGANLSGATWLDGRICGDNSIVRGDERSLDEACR